MCSRRSVATSPRLQAAGKRVAIALWSEGARERMSHVLADHKLVNLTPRRVVAAGTGAAENIGGARRARHRERLRDRGRSPSSASRTFSATAWCGRAGPAAGRKISSPKSPALRPATSSCMSITASAASSACRRSRPPARRMIVWNFITRKQRSSTCRSRTSSCCRATAPSRPMSSSTGLAAAAGRRARRGSRAASAKSPAS